MNFKEKLLAAIDESFGSLGECCKQAIYFNLEQNYALNKQNIPNKIEDFSEALEDIFGTGIKVLQCMIMRNLFKRIKRPIPYLENQETFDFINYLYSARTVCNLSFFENLEKVPIRTHLQ